jgi:glycosyltransferase involved in cell wall biosynthesis
MPRMPIEPLVERAKPLGDRVRFVPRFVVDREIPAFFERADLVVLPYREIDQSGVLFTALAFNRPILATRVGGFGEIADRHGAIEVVPPGETAALAEAINRLIADPARRAELSAAAAALASGELSWPAIARRTAELYRRVSGV